MLDGDSEPHILKLRKYVCWSLGDAQEASSPAGLKGLVCVRHMRTIAQGNRAHTTEKGPVNEEGSVRRIGWMKAHVRKEQAADGRNRIRVSELDSVLRDGEQIVVTNTPAPM